MPSRISGACNACRAKKQKCSGDRAGCTQCREADQECTWPAQRKRGPAKGYIEGLEHRLRETESLLLQVLPVVPEDYLDAVVTDPEGLLGRNTTTIRRPTLNNKTGVEYWEHFPLDSIDNIRRWQQDCAEGRSSYHTSSPSSEDRMPLMTHEDDTKDHMYKSLSQYQQSTAPSVKTLTCREDESTERAQNWSGVGSTTARSMFARQAVSGNPGMQSWDRPGETTMPHQLSQNSSKVYLGQFGLSAAEDSGIASFYPTDFQRQFFW